MDWLVKSVVEGALLSVKAVESELERFDAGVRMMVSQNESSASSSSGGSSSAPTEGIEDALSDGFNLDNKNNNDIHQRPKLCMIADPLVNRPHRVPSKYLEVTDAVLAFVDSLASRIENFTTVAVDHQNEFTLTNAEQDHCMTVLTKSKKLAVLRYKVAPLMMTENKFWAIYFQHYENYVHSTAIEALGFVDAGSSIINGEPTDKTKPASNSQLTVPAVPIVDAGITAPVTSTPSVAAASTTSPSVSPVLTAATSPNIKPQQSIQPVQQQQQQQQQRKRVSTKSARTSSVPRVGPASSTKPKTRKQNEPPQDTILQDFYQVSSSDWREDEEDESLQDFVEIPMPVMISATRV